jgi:hypothetical protein
MYLNDLAEEMRDYKVVTYSDHFPDKFIRYFDDYDKAIEYYKDRIGDSMNANHVAGVALIRVATGDVITRDSWRVFSGYL